jgi:hypothetical protein
MSCCTRSSPGSVLFANSTATALIEFSPSASALTGFKLEFGQDFTLPRPTPTQPAVDFSAMIGMI